LLFWTALSLEYGDCLPSNQASFGVYLSCILMRHLNRFPISNTKSGPAARSAPAHVAVFGGFQGFLLLGMLSLFSPSCASKTPGPPTRGEGSLSIGERHEGQYHLGPVDFDETAYHNACAPAGGYQKQIRDTVGLSGEYIAGVSNELSGGGSICDACMKIETAQGESIVARIVTYGVEQAPGDIDVSPSVFAAISHDEYPRSMVWSLVACPKGGSILLEYKGDSNPFWTALWVRNATIPIERVTVSRGTSQDEQELWVASDGSRVLDSGFGEGAFTVTLTSVLGEKIEKTFDGFAPGSLVDTGLNFEE
jgi:hypothetical protein